MTPALLPTLGGAMTVAGLIGIVIGLRRTPVTPPGPTRARAWTGRVAHRLVSLSPLMRAAAAVGVLVGVVVALLTGWLIAVPLVPAAVLGLPVLLSTPPSTARIERLEAMEEWARSLSSGLSAGRGLDQALIKSLRTTPDAIRPEVSRLVNRLWAHWSTEDALRAFADDLDDATGDLLVANLILGTRRRGTGLAAVLEGLAESVAADVRARRQIDADQAKPRTTARYVTLFTIGVLGFLALTGSYIEPYRSPVGQLVLAALLAAYIATLIWMRRMAVGAPLPRFLNDPATSRPNAPPAGTHHTETPTDAGNLLSRPAATAAEAGSSASGPAQRDGTGRGQP